MRFETYLKDDWKFKITDDCNAYRPSYDDSAYRLVRVPHDYAIEGPFDEQNDAQFTEIEADGILQKIGHPGRTGGLPIDKRAVYRKRFFIDAAYCNGVVCLEFGGIMFNSSIYVNGIKVGSQYYGYTSFCLDITEAILFGSENLLSVIVEPHGDASRWYTGTGIYRNVMLVCKSKMHIAYNGVCVKAQTQDKHARLHINTTVHNLAEQEGLELESAILTPCGQEKAVLSTPVHIAKSQTVLQSMDLPDIQRWDIESPILYTLVSTLLLNGEAIDEYRTVFGIRDIELKKDGRLMLNGRHVPLKGVCMHHDLGALGAAMHKDALERQLDILMDMGCNAIRTSHNPPAQELLDLCDQKGLLVMDEAFDEWRSRSKLNRGYAFHFDKEACHDLESLITRDRNHPCVFMWSIGNEILDQYEPQGAATAKWLADICRQLDDTRPVTVGINGPEKAFEYGLTDQVDVLGVNYCIGNYRKYHDENPGVLMLGSETVSCVSSRGEYLFPVEEQVGVKKISGYHHVSSYDMQAPGWAYTPDRQFEALEDNPFIFGEFVWTGFDYLGEPTPFYGEWPSRSSYFGIIDLAGLPKDRFYSYKSRWSGEDVLHVFPHWNWEGREGEITPVHCYTSYTRGELFVNGISQGICEKTNENTYTKNRLMWNHVEYEPGEIKVIALDKEGGVLAEKIIRTAGSPARILLSANKSDIAADGDSLVFVTAKIVDEDGVFCPRADNEIEFSVKGGEFLASDAGDQTSLIDFPCPRKPAFNGLIVGIFRSIDGFTGKIQIEAKAAGLKTAEICINAFA